MAEEAKAIQRVSEIMIATTSHDMRTPLNTIINMHSMIMKRLTSLGVFIQDPQIKDWLNRANKSTGLLQFLVNDALDFFQIKSGKFRVRMETFNVRDVVHEVFDFIQIQMADKKLNMIIDIEEDLHDLNITFDKQRLSQVLMNLLSNSLKFTFQGDIKISIRKVPD